MIKSDCHMHTCFSADSEAPVTFMLDAAVEKGLEGVCITDHMDLDFPETPDFPANAFQFDLDEYFGRLNRLKEQYKDKLDLRKHLGEAYHRLTETYPFDFVIGSVHLVGGQDPYYRKIFEGKTDEEVYRMAFRETLEDVAAVKDFDALGHLDYVVRYGIHQAAEYSYRKFSDEIDAVLKKLIAEEIGVEEEKIYGTETLPGARRGDHYDRGRCS